MNSLPPAYSSNALLEQTDLAARRAGLFYTQLAHAGKTITRNDVLGEAKRPDMVRRGNTGSSRGGGGGAGGAGVGQGVGGICRRRSIERAVSPPASQGKSS